MHESKTEKKKKLQKRKSFYLFFNTKKIVSQCRSVNSFSRAVVSDGSNRTFEPFTYSFLFYRYFSHYDYYQQYASTTANEFHTMSAKDFFFSEYKFLIS